MEQRYIKYKEIVGVLQHQLDESKRQIQECRVLDYITHSARYVYATSNISFMIPRNAQNETLPPCNFNTWPVERVLCTLTPRAIQPMTPSEYTGVSSVHNWHLHLV